MIIYKQIIIYIMLIKRLFFQDDYSMGDPKNGLSEDSKSKESEEEKEGTEQP